MIYREIGEAIPEKLAYGMIVVVLRTKTLRFIWTPEGDSSERTPHVLITIFIGEASRVLPLRSRGRSTLVILIFIKINQAGSRVLPP